MPLYPKTQSKSKTQKPDSKLWTIFSIFIRLRDSNENGYAQCFTCKAWRYWRDGDCGHGISRGHMATKYNEKNNHFQCKKCNAPPNNGKPIQYKEEMNKRYGLQTWEMMEIAAKQVCKWARFEFEMLGLHYVQEIKKLLVTKKLKPEDEDNIKKFLKL